MHEIQALICSDAATAVVANAWSASVRQELASGVFIVPLSPTLLRQMVGGDVTWPDLESVESVQELAATCEPLVRALQTVRPPGYLALVLTQYFGGEGEQAALLLREGFTPSF